MFVIPQCTEFISGSLYKIPEYAGDQHYKQETANNIFALLLRLNEFFTVFEKLFLVGSTIAIAAFTYTLWRATTGLFIMAQRQSDDMRESLDIAKQSADAATKTVDTMKDTASKELRAYVAPAAASIEVLPGRVLAKIEIRNTGKTMAKETRVRVDFRPDKMTVMTYADDVHITDYSIWKTGKSILMPNSVWRHYAEIPRTEDEFEKLKHGVDKITISGRIDYIDIFDQARWTIFSFLNGQPSYSGEEIIGWDVEATEQGNDAT
jgi:hypothetical protein